MVDLNRLQENYFFRHDCNNKKNLDASTDSMRFSIKESINTSTDIKKVLIRVIVFISML